jgi:hypothetical protein
MQKDWGINQPRKKNKEIERAIKEARELKDESQRNIINLETENKFILFIGIPVICFLCYFIFTLF